jgi:hypothetical protein
MSQLKILAADAPFWVHSTSHFTSAASPAADPIVRREKEEAVAGKTLVVNRPHRSRRLAFASAASTATLALAALAPAPARAANIALGRAVLNSGPTWPGFNGYNLTDDNLNTIVHPAEAVSTYSYLIDLGQTANVIRIDLVNRADCCPERLTNYRVSLLDRAPGGGPGTAVYSADVRTDRTNSGLGGVDTLSNVNAAGRYLQIEKIDDGTTDYYLQIAEVKVEGAAPQTNVARGRPVIATAGTWPGYPASNLTDGTAASFSHPEAGDGSAFSFDIDLGRSYDLDRILLYNRGDNCCSERLTNYTVSLLSDNGGTPGETLWSALVRADGSNSGNAGLDELFAADGTGTFSGRWIRVESEGTAYGPQIAEVEAYAVPEPTGLCALGLAAGVALTRRRRRPVTASQGRIFSSAPAAGVFQVGFALSVW